MRTFLGWLVLIAGVASLGYWAMIRYAPAIEAQIAADAGTVAQSALHDVQVAVSGRDVQVSGLVNDPVELALLQASFEGIDGVRHVGMLGIETLPVADPYEITFTRSDGTSRLSGVIPSENARATFGGFGPNLTLAAGAPDENWTAVAHLGINSIDRWDQGEVVLSGRTLRITGLAETPAEVEETRRILSHLPNNYSYTLDVDVEDDGTPLRLNLVLRDGVLSGGGKLPAEMSQSELNDRFTIADADPLDLTQSTLAAADPDWPDAARVGFDALANLIDGDLSFEGSTLTLTGAGTPEGAAQAEALLASVPNAYIVTSNIMLWDDGIPLQMTMEWDGTRATVTGKLPADFTPRPPAELAVVDDAQRSFRPDELGDFTRNADAGSAALGLLETGQVTVTVNAIALTGTATLPQVEADLDAAFATLPETVQISRDLTYLDDGSPAAWRLDYSAQEGATLQGRLPNGMTLETIGDRLGVPVSGTPATALADTNSEGGFETLDIAATYLPELEALQFVREEAGGTLDLIMSPGVDLDLVALDLADRLPTDVAFSLAPLDPLPAEGSTRINAASGLPEIFAAGFWLPDLSFTPDQEGCTDQIAALTQRAKISFLSASSRLDATSIRAINGLTAVVGLCAEAGLVLEIGGHTDASGDADDNQDLSLARATAVRDALAQRGIALSSMVPVGYGQSQPIADNDTVEGRTANRRTTLTFSDPLTP